MHDTEQCDCVSELQLNIDQMLSCEWIQFKNKNDIINKVLPAAYNLEKKLWLQSRWCIMQSYRNETITCYFSGLSMV